MSVPPSPQDAATEFGLGMFYSELIMFFIIVSTASTIYKAGAKDVGQLDLAGIAQVLRPLAGDAAGLGRRRGQVARRRWGIAFEHRIGWLHGQINGSGREIHDEGDYAGHKKKQQAEAVKGRHLPVNAIAMRPVAAFRMDQRAAACEATKRGAQSKHVANEMSAVHYTSGNKRLRQASAGRDSRPESLCLYRLG